MKYFAKIRYLGTDFHGFQVQPDGMRTVQGELCAALSAAFGVPTSVTGCSRTDAGVHANEFCITVENDGGTIPPDKLPIAVSRFLPPDLSLYYAKEIDQNFHPRYDVKEKEYLYRIINQKIYDPFNYGRAWFVGRIITDEGIRLMRSAAEHLIGKHDFTTFMSEGSDITDCVRTIKYITIEKNDSSIDIKIAADGFLYNMVRIIVGTLVEVAYGRFKPDDIPVALNARDRSRVGMTAPPEGLYLNCVRY